LTSILLPSSFHPTPSIRLAIPAALLAIGISGCSGADVGAPSKGPLPGLPTSAGTTSAAPSKSPEVAATDFGRLLLTAADLSDAEDTFSQRSKQSQPNGSPGASAFFVNDKDDRAISDTVLVYPDAAAATATLHQSAGALTTTVAGGTPKPVSVGSDGVMATGTHPDENKAVTLMFFTEGRALVRLEFQSAIGDTTTDRFVTDIGKMQQIALRFGLPAAP
jgi:hypothetical protein